MGREGREHADAGALDDFVEAFESAWERDGAPRLEAFLPPADHPLRSAVLRELIRVDLEYSRERGSPRRLADYELLFPELFRDPDGLRAVAFEEYRLRRLAGEPAAPEEYADRFGIDTSGWPRSAVTPLPATVRVAGLRADRADFSLDQPFSLGGSSGANGAKAARFPAVGEEFLGFRLVAELGRGAFGRVYLAEQADLAGRRVALKLTTHLAFAEPQTLARLQHTNIVPIYSAHRAGPFEAVCMPYFGPTTLAHLLSHLRRQDAWPESGKELAATLANLHSLTLPDGGSGRGKDGASASPFLANAEVSPTPDGAVALKVLESYSYAEAVLWIGARLADGLAHAHERGILHRDLKPANVLLSDDGQPMLLDFNLAADAARGPAGAGGTPAYMAPEQLESAQDRTRPKPDGRADVYALGVLLFEFLTGRHPFPQRDGPVATVLPLLLADRLGPPPRLRTLNPNVSPATEAIVRRCLEPNPAKRCPSARALGEDLECQVAHRPLRHVREPSVRERLRKWRWRNPRLAAVLGVTALAAVVVLGLAGLATARGERIEGLEAERTAALARYEAAGQLGRLRAEVRPIQYLLAARAGEPEKLDEGIESCRRALGLYGVPDDPLWESRPAVANLDDEGRRELRGHVGELLVLLAQATALRAELRTAAERDAALVEALRLNELAGNCLPDEARAVREQRAGLVLRRSDAAEARRLKELAEASPPQTARDFYLSAAGHVAAGGVAEAVPLLEEATRREPRHFWAWFLLGVCHDRQGRDVHAEGCYGACIALWPDFPWSHFNRGLTHLRRRDHARARADFSEAIRLRPDLADAHVNRALTELGLNRPVAAVADLTRALELGVPYTRVYFLRARAKELAGDPAGAKADREEGFRRKPTDEPSFVARGLARADADPAGALRDFDRALELNPRSFPALQNRAYVLDAKLNKPDESRKALDRAIELYPDSAQARGGRGVLLARAGDREAALRDAEVCLRNATDPATLYQVAGIYAQTSKVNPDDRREAIRLLASALRQGYGLELIDRDGDLDPIRKLPEFIRLVEAARELAGGRPKAK